MSGFPQNLSVSLKVVDNSACCEICIFAFLLKLTLGDCHQSVLLASKTTPNQVNSVDPLVIGLYTELRLICGLSVEKISKKCL